MSRMRKPEFVLKRCQDNQERFSWTPYHGVRILLALLECDNMSSLFSVKYVPSWIPGAGFQAYAKEVHKMSTTMRDVPYNDAKKALVGYFFNFFLASFSLHVLITAL